MTRDEHSWNHGLVRGPDDSSRVSIHSPPRAMLPRCSSAHSSFSEMPGFSAASISPIAASQATIARRMHRISSGDLMRRAFSITASPLPTEMPRRASSADAFRVEMVDGDAAVAAAMLR